MFYKLVEKKRGSLIERDTIEINKVISEGDFLLIEVDGEPNILSYKVFKVSEDDFEVLLFLIKRKRIEMGCEKCVIHKIKISDKNTRKK